MATTCKDCGAEWSIDGDHQCPQPDVQFKRCTECGEAGHPWWDHERKPGFTFGEEPMEAYVDEHITTLQHEDGKPCGVDITTRGQRRKMMSDNNIEYRPIKYQYGMKKKIYFDQKGR